MKTRLLSRLGPVVAVAGWLLTPASAPRADAPPGRYTVAADTVLDTRTQLTWQRNVPGSRYTQTEAFAYCAGLVTGGYSDWRLPSVSELLTLVDPTRADPAIDTTAFPSTPSELFWTSSLYVGRSGFAWNVTFLSGNTFSFAVGNAVRVRCVR